MKKVFLKIILPMLIICGAILSIGVSCGPGTAPTPVGCDSTATRFMALYNAHPFTSVYSMDLQVFEYTFTSSVAGDICAIGYQGHPNLVSTNAYKIEIIDATNSVVKSTGTYTFPSGNRGYKNLGATVPIAANTPYIIRRTVVNNLVSIGNVITYSKNVGPVLPLINGTLTITATKAYDFYSGSQTSVMVNTILPLIDFVIN